MMHPAVFNVSEVCYKLGVRNVVISPGSRNAPLTISFARNEKIKKWVIPDERVAAFIGLGIAQSTKEPVVLVCTSGTAVLNYAPAVTEAYYREIPLIVISADRPLELIDQRDGQTIRQFGVLKNHVKNSYQLPECTDQNAREFLSKLVEASLHSQELPLGPVHINIPFKEPFYPEANQDLKFIDINIEAPNKEVSDESIPDWSGFQNVMVLVGQKEPDEDLDKILTTLAKKVPVICSPLSNINSDGCIRNADLFINDQKELSPELLITFGQSVLSKKLKNHIRKNKPKEHWHVDPAGIKVDTYDSSPKLIKTAILDILQSTQEKAIDSNFLQKWYNAVKPAEDLKKQFLENTKYGELLASSMLFQALPPDTVLHLGNSMPVRYAEMLGVNKELTVYSNRGTSGIDGISSTAVGSALADSEKLHILLTGDVSFLYDRNAFFHQYRIPNLRIVVMNNQGGGIFRLIDGPANQPELENYFETRHSFTAKSVSLEHSFGYEPAHNKEELENGLKSFFEKSANTKVLEIFTEPRTNQQVYKQFRSLFN